MTPTHLRDCLEALRWSQRELAAVLGCNDRLVRRWAVGAPSYAVLESVGEWLEVLATAHVRHPTPTDWRGFPADTALCCIAGPHMHRIDTGVCTNVSNLAGDFWRLRRPWRRA